MQASWNQWSNPVNNYAATSFSNTFPTGPNVGNATSFPVPPVTPVTNAPLANSQFSNLYGSQPPPTSQQQQWQQWEQWQQQYAQWQQQYGDKFQGSPGMMPGAVVPNAFPTIPPLPPSAPSAQPPPPDSVPPADKDESNKRPHDSTGNEDSKKQKTGKGKQETLESLIESEKTFDQQFNTWEGSFLQWKEQNVNHPDKTQYKEYEAKCESYREQLLQKREVLRKKRENKEAEVAAAAKEAALATSSSKTSQQAAYNPTGTTQNNPYLTAPPSMMYPPIPSMYSPQDTARVMPNQTTNAFMPNYSMYSMPPPPSLPPMTGPPLLGSVMDDDSKKKTPQSLEFLSAAPTISNAKSIPGLDLVGSDRHPNASFHSHLPPASSLFTPYSQDITKPLHTSEDKPFNFPRPPAQQNFNNNLSNNSNNASNINNSMQNQYSYPPGRPEFENDSRMNHSARNVPYSQFDRSNLNRDSKDRFQNQNRDTNDRFQNQGRDNNDRFQSQSSYPPKDYGNRNNNQFRQNEPDSNYRNNDRNKFGGGGGGGGGNTSSFSFNSDKYAKYLEDEYDDSRFRDPDPEDDYSSRKSDFQRDQSYRNNFAGRQQNYRNDSNSFFGKNRGGDRDFSNRQFQGDSDNREDGRTSFQDRGGKDRNFGGFNREGNRFGGRGGFGKTPFGRDISDMKEPSKEVQDVGKSSPMDTSKPVSLLDLPMMKPPDTFEKFQESSAKLPVPFDSKISQPLMKPPEPFDKNQMSVDVPESTLSSENGFAPVIEAPKSLNVADTMSVPPPQDDLTLREPFVPSQIFEYDHGANCSENPLSFEPLWVFDYSHGKKKGSEPFTLPESDLITDSASENLVKNKESWDGDPWGKTEKQINMTPLPERTRNIPSTTTTTKDLRDSNTPVSLFDKLDKRVPLDSEDKQDKKHDISWVHPKITLTRLEEKPTSKLIDDLLLVPGRNTRPSKLVIFMRGPPGSGKSHTAKLIKDKEVELGGSAPRILSIDDYFSIEDLENGETDSEEKGDSAAIQYNYDAALEASYLESLVKSFKKNISDGFFPFIIVDCVNDKLKKYEDMYNFAKSKGFQVYTCEMSRDIDICKKQNVHGRSEEDILKIIDEWEPTPSWQTVLDIQILLKTDTEMEIDPNEDKAEEQDAEKVEENIDLTKEPETESTDPSGSPKAEDEPTSSAENEAEDYSSYMEVLCSSKWEKMEQTEEKLARLDGVNNRKRSTSFKEWLQLPEESDRDLSWYTSKDADSTPDISSDVSAPRKKRQVRWADLEERVAQQKMREIGFVVGHTDWKRMMDPSFGGNALTQTKYI